MFVWLLSNNKRVAYARVGTRDLLYSSKQEARGTLCGKMVTLFLKVTAAVCVCKHLLRCINGGKEHICVHVQPPGKRVTGLSVQAKLDAYLWFGTCSDAGHMLEDLPAGFRPATGGADTSSPPSYLLSAGEAALVHRFWLHVQSCAKVYVFSYNPLLCLFIYVFHVDNTKYPLLHQ